MSNPNTGTSTYEYVATFNLALQAVGEPITFGLPNSTAPAFGASSTPPNIAETYVNGIPSPTPGMVASYSAPSNTTLSNNGTAFTIAQNQSVNIPVSYTFFVNTPGTNTYSVRLNGVDYSVGSSLSSIQFYPLSGAQTVFVLVPTGGIMTASVANALQEFLSQY